MRDPLNLSDADFDAVMMEIDAKVRGESDSVFGREIWILAEFTRRFQLSLSDTDPTTIRIFAWCDEVYGERLKGNFERGYSMVLIKGDVCKLHNWPVFGIHAVACESRPLGRDARFRSSTGEIPLFNLLEGWVEGVTPALAERVSAEERKEILRVYALMSCAFAGLDDARTTTHGQLPYVKEAIDDLSLSVDSCLQKNPNYGQSKWASLQASEKVLKSGIVALRGEVKLNHNLSVQCASLAAAGGPSINDILISAIQCKADVRYDSRLVNKTEALAAHYAALDVCGIVAPILAN